MYQKKMWTLGGWLADHRQVFFQVPRIFGAYVGKNSIEPSLNESVMVTVNSANSCPFCEGLHGELARMAGVEEVDSLMQAQSLQECETLSDESAIRYARIFAECNGRGPNEEKAFAILSSTEGEGRARSIKALCWFLLWGSIGGNTINGFLSRFRGAGSKDSSVVFELVFSVYYGPLFLLIAVVNGLLRFFPKVPAWFSASLGVLLTIIASVWIIPLGFFSMIVPSKPNILIRSDSAP